MSFYILIILNNIGDSGSSTFNMYKPDVNSDTSIWAPIVIPRFTVWLLYVRISYLNFLNTASF